MLLVSFLAAASFTVGGVLIGLSLAYFVVAQAYKDADEYVSMPYDENSYS